MSDYVEALAKVTRVEFISVENGRELVRHGKLEFSLQDDGRTLKIFKSKSKNEETDSSNRE